MTELQKTAAALLKEEKVQLVIGYGSNREGGIRAEFIRRPDQVERLIWDENCRQNLAVYLSKPEVRSLGRIALVCLPYTSRTVIQLAAESQLQDREIVVMIPGNGGGVAVIESLELLRDTLRDQEREWEAHDRETIEKLRSMNPEERWSFWMKQFSRCFKCYACRSACPLCYCARCTTEMNQPQWIPAPSHHLGNLEWHIMRAMHLAGRCSGCGECGRACPMGIPVHLLSLELDQEVFRLFQTRGGESLMNENTLAVFKPNDSGDFIR